MHSERMSVMARKVKSQRYDCGQVHGESLNTSLIKTKPPISNGNPKSDYSDMEGVHRAETILSQKWLVMGARSQEGKLARD